MFVSVFLAAALLASDPAVTPATVAPEPEAQPAATPESEKLICRRMDDTGAGRTARRKVCQTKEQWRAQDQRGGVEVSGKGGAVKIEKR